MAASTRRCESIDDIDVVPPMCCFAILSLMIAFGTAARPGAILQLKTDQIDLAHRLIDFNPQAEFRPRSADPSYRSATRCCLCYGISNTAAKTNSCRISRSVAAKEFPGQSEGAPMQRCALGSHVRTLEWLPMGKRNR
jgi:hypothetical protein